VRRRSLANLRRKAAQRPPGYLQAALDAAEEVNEREGWYTLSDEAFMELRKRFSTPVVSSPANVEAQKSSWIDAIKRVAEGASGTVKVALGIDATPADLLAARHAICQACELYTPCLRGTLRCCGALLTGTADGVSTGCGCIVGIDKGDHVAPSGKLMLARKKCPRSRW